MPDRLHTSRIVPAIALAFVAFAMLLSLHFLHSATSDEVAAARHAAELDALHAVLPAGLYDNDPLLDRIDVQAADAFGEPSTTVLRARRNGTATAVVLRATVPKAYSGPIQLLIGLRADGSVLAVRVTAHRETPGLGDAIEIGKSRWIDGFSGKSLSTPPAEQWTVRRDGGEFDQFAGATITPRAIVLQMRKVLEYFSAHRDEILAPAGAARE